VDKTTIAGIQANLLHYVKGEATREVPIWRMIAATADEVAARARALIAALGEAGARCEVVLGQSMIGGGSLPEETLPTALIAVEISAPSDAARALRLGDPAVVSRVQDDLLLLDLRTVLPREEEALIARLREVI